ncbi:MAG: DUF58 domain-containing protein, partial [bacterium]
MDLLAPTFLKRLHRLRDRLGGLLHRFEFLRPTPAGQLVTPEPESHRPYTPGDDPRYIDWNIYARQERFFVKTVVREQEGVVHLLVDASASMTTPHPEKRRRAVETAAGIGYLALLAGNEVTLHSWSDRLMTTRSFDQGERDAPDLLGRLSNLPQGLTTDLGRSLEQVRQPWRHPSSRLLIISDFIETGPFWEQFDLLARGGSRPAAMQVLHEEEARPRIRGLVRLTDPETGRQSVRVVGHRRLREYRESMKRFLSRTDERFALARVPFMRAYCEKPFEELVVEFFKLPAWSRRR